MVRGDSIKGQNNGSAGRLCSWWRIIYCLLLQFLSMNELSSSESPAQDICEDSTHTFILRSIDGSQRAMEDVELSLPRTTGLPQGPAIVVFNEDHKPYTPAFVSCAQQAELDSLDSDYKTIFESKVRHSRRPQLPDPRKAKSGQNPYYLSPSSDYCLICHEIFENYFKHINHPVHLKKISDSVGEEYIGELVHHVRLEAERRERCLRTQLKIKKRKKTESFNLSRHIEKEQENRHRNINFQQKSQMANKQSTS